MTLLLCLLAVASALLVPDQAASAVKAVDQPVEHSNLAVRDIYGTVHDTDVSSETKCTYGERDVGFGTVFGYAIAHLLVYSLITIGVTAVGGTVLFVPFGGNGFVIAAALSTIVADIVRIRFRVNDFFGPGDGFVDGASANRITLVQLAVGTAFFKLLLLLAGLYCLAAGSVGDYGFREFLGFPIGLGVSAFSTYYAYTRGYPGQFVGSEGDSFNPVQCSGPSAWRDLSTTVRFVEIAILVGPTISNIPVIGFLWNIAVIVVARYAIADKPSHYHLVNVVCLLISAVLFFVGGFFRILARVFDIQTRAAPFTSSDLMERFGPARAEKSDEEAQAGGMFSILPTSKLAEQLSNMFNRGSSS